MKTLDYSQKRCLIIEDRRPFLLLLKGLLSTLGATNIVTELSAEAGIKACKVKKFDIIVCDLHLGNKRKNGFEFLEELRTLHIIRPSTIFIMISGDSDRSIVLGSIEKQPDDYLIKPFSQAQLNLRITRAMVRRTTLCSLYSQIEHGKYPLAIQTCQHFISTEAKFNNHLLQILVELYWKVEDYESAQETLDTILKNRQVPWALCGLAKTKLLQNDFTQAILLSKKAIANTINNVAAYDILAQAYLQSNQKTEALTFILEALALSPLSIERHFKVCEIARENQEYELAMTSAKSIFMLSQRSVHKNVNHLCGYVRSILDIVEHADNKNTRNKFMQESVLVMHRAKNDDSVRIASEDFDFDIFESVIQARMQYLEGNINDAKKTLEKSQVDIEQTYPDYPLAMAADSLKVMLDLGDYDEAAKLIKIIRDNPDKVNGAILHLTETESLKIQKSRAQYIQHNKLGVSLYSQGNYSGAYEEFCAAKEVSPLNIGVNLNLMQSLSKLISHCDNPNEKHLLQIKGLYKYIATMPLKNVHKTKFESMRKEVEEIVL